MNERICDWKDATNVQSWFFIDTYCTPHNISMLSPLMIALVNA